MLRPKVYLSGHALTGAPHEIVIDGAIADLMAIKAGDPVTFSSDGDATQSVTVVGITKPDPRIFQIALDRLAVSPAETIMVGDSPSADIAGAHAAGIRAALLDPHGLYPWCAVPHFDDVPEFTDALLASGEVDSFPGRNEPGGR